ncbi:unnamed protein product, partial [Durusdinium trenchii]
DEMLKSARATAKSMSDTLWQVSGTGKTVNTPLKEVIMGVSKVVSQLDGTVTKQSKSLEKVTTLLEKLNSSMEALVEVERRKSSMEDRPVPHLPDQILDQPVDQPVAQRLRLMRQRRQQWPRDSRKRHW